MIHEKTSSACYIIDVACPFDTRVKTKELEKVERYQDLKREIGRIWECRNVCVVPIVIGAFSGGLAGMLSCDRNPGPLKFLITGPFVDIFEEITLLFSKISMFRRI